MLFREHIGRTVAITDPKEEIEFNSIIGEECRTTSQLVAQVYDFQRYIAKLYPPSSKDSSRLRHYLEFMHSLEKDNVLKKTATIRHKPPPEKGQKI